MSINLSTVLSQADELSQQLRALLADPQRVAHVEMKRRIHHEFLGYDFKASVPRYRCVPAQYRGLLLEAGEIREGDLPTRHISYGKYAIVRESLLSFRDMVGFMEALEVGQDSVKRPINLENLYGYARGLPPGFGIKILSGWELIPSSSLMQMLNAIHVFIHGINN